MRFLDTDVAAHLVVWTWRKGSPVEDGEVAALRSPRGAGLSCGRDFQQPGVDVCEPRRATRPSAATRAGSEGRGPRARGPSIGQIRRSVGRYASFAVDELVETSAGSPDATGKRGLHVSCRVQEFLQQNLAGMKAGVPSKSFAEWPGLARSCFFGNISWGGSRKFEFWRQNVGRAYGFRCHGILNGKLPLPEVVAE